MWQHMADVEQFSTGTDDNTSATKFNVKNSKPERFQLKYDMLIYISRQCSTAIKSFQDRVTVLLCG